MVALRSLALVVTLVLCCSGRALALIELPQETGSSSDPGGVDEQSGGNALAAMQEWAGTMGVTEVISDGSPDTQTSPATRNSDSEVPIPFAVRSTNARDIIYLFRNAAPEVWESESLEVSWGGSAGSSDPFRNFTPTALRPLTVLTHPASCDRGAAQNQGICESERELEREDRQRLSKRKKIPSGDQPTINNSYTENNAAAAVVPIIYFPNSIFGMSDVDSSQQLAMSILIASGIMSSDLTYPTIDSLDLSNRAALWLPDPMEEDGLSDAFSNYIPYLPSTALTIVSLIRSVKAAPAVPEPSTWAMVTLGFVGLGFASYCASRKRASLAA